MQTSALDVVKRDSNEQGELKKPLVSIGVPVYNGELFLKTALELLVNQTYNNIEIIISNNNSSDKSFEIIQEFAEKDSRIYVYTQGETISALNNFRFVFEKSKGNYFMWAACDDRRSLDYIEGLLEVFKITPSASISFGDLAVFSDNKEWPKAQPIDYTFETVQGESWLVRAARETRSRCFHVYGLIRTSALKEYGWHDLDYAPDVPLLVHLSFSGEFVKARRGRFYYFLPPINKSKEERALVNNLRPLKPFPKLRLSWACALAAQQANKCHSFRILSAPVFFITYYNHRVRLTDWLLRYSPKILLVVYRKWFKRNHV